VRNSNNALVIHSTKGDAMNVQVSCDLKLQWFSQALNEAETYKRAHAQNVFNRIAFTYFKDQDHLNALIDQVKVELLLEGQHLPEDTKFMVK
jgi:hypothetical protein